MITSAFFVLTSIAEITCVGMADRDYRHRWQSRQIASQLVDLTPRIYRRHLQSPDRELRKHCEQLLLERELNLFARKVKRCRPRNHPCWPDIDCISSIKNPRWLPEGIWQLYRDHEVRKPFIHAAPSDIPEGQPYWNSYRYSTYLLVCYLLDTGRSVKEIQGLVQDMADHEKDMYFSDGYRYMRGYHWRDGYLHR